MILMVSFWHCCSDSRGFCVSDARERENKTKVVSHLAVDI